MLLQLQRGPKALPEEGVLDDLLQLLPCRSLRAGCSPSGEEVHVTDAEEAGCHPVR